MSSEWWPWDRKKTKTSEAERAYVQRVRANKKNASRSRRLEHQKQLRKKLLLLGDRAVMEMHPDDIRIAIRTLSESRQANHRRRKAVIRATPGWVNPEVIEALYMEAIRKECDTSEQHHVDHIVPLQSKIVCGLHCEANLRVVPRKYNSQKGNRWWPDMP